MKSKRVLLIAEDRLINNLYRARLEAAGFNVDATREGANGLRLAADREPDAVILDPILSTPGAPEIIHGLRSSPATQQVPIITLPTNRAQFAEAALKAGATSSLGRTVNPIATAIDAVETALGLIPTAALDAGTVFVADETWQKQGQQSAPEAIQAMRHTLHAAARDPHDGHSMREFLQLIHNFTEQMALLGQRPAFHLGAAIETLAHDLAKLPSQCNTSTSRTLAQAVDFLTVLMTDKARSFTWEPGFSQALVIDDEGGARKIMMAAVELVGLKAIAADSPDTALAALGAEMFDLLLVDISMPTMTGFELCAKVRKMERHERTPIVFITGMSTFQNRVQSSLSGGNDFVGKPFHLAELGVKALVWVFRGRLGLV